MRENKDDRKCSRSIEFILCLLITIVMMLSYALYKEYYQQKIIKPQSSECKI